MNTLEIGEVIAGLVRVTVLVGIGYFVNRLARRVPWPFKPFRWRYLLVHAAAAGLAVLTFWATTNFALFVLLGRRMEPDRLSELMLIGSYLYIVIAGAAHASQATARAARAEAAAAQMQLATLRTQIEPHFLFNALHTVVQLIPIDPARAMEAAELVAQLLRTTMEDDRDIVSLDDEWRFVARYLELERIRFGDRLVVEPDIDPELLDERVPSFALQTLVENAVRHGAAPRVEPTVVAIAVTGTPTELRLSVRNHADPLPANGGAARTGTGLNRLRERLTALHGSGAWLSCGARDDGAFEAVVIVPRQSE